ncbi:MAG: purine-binding chemotaxis protein CheW [Spirochaetes bacterium]|nr:purine-binding chemotaxis protein CheW [Spirochaetota bacterium]
MDDKLKREQEQENEDLRQYVTFLVGGEIYGVSVMKVQSINEMSEITQVPRARSFIKGVINLRGAVIPVIDMRKKFGLPEKEYDSFTVILIVEARERLIGMIVDSVSDVVSIPASNIQTNINYSGKLEKSSMEGVGRIDESLIILLDVESFLSNENVQEA